MLSLQRAVAEPEQQPHEEEQGNHADNPALQQGLQIVIVGVLGYSTLQLRIVAVEQFGEFEGAVACAQDGELSETGKVRRPQGQTVHLARQLDVLFGVKKQLPTLLQLVD